jgi:hypothetical protein
MKRNIIISLLYCKILKKNTIDLCCTLFQFKANHNKKGPYGFGQLKSVQDLSGEHTVSCFSLNTCCFSYFILEDRNKNILQTCSKYLICKQCV